MKTSLLFFARLVCCSGFAIGMICPAHAEDPQTITSEQEVSGKWSDNAMGVIPADQSKFHGPFNAQPVSLKMENLPTHEWVRVRLTLYTIGSWDGSSRVWGPDLWTMQVRGGQRLFFSSFCNMGEVSNNNLQSYPDDYPRARNLDRTGASGKNSLGFPKQNGVSNFPTLNDGTYQIEAVFPHAKNTLTLDFAGIYDGAPSEQQWWGLANVEIVTMAMPPLVDDREFPELWEKLASKNAMEAQTALWKMISAGDRALAFIQGKVTALTKAAAGNRRQALPLSAQDAIRLHRAHKISNIIDTVGSGSLSYEIAHLIPEYALDLNGIYETGPR